jgi:hypothetical protein
MLLLVRLKGGAPDVSIDLPESRLSNSRYSKRLQIGRARDIVKVKQNVYDVLPLLNARFIDFHRLNCRCWVGKRGDLKVNIDHHAYH